MTILNTSQLIDHADQHNHLLGGLLKLTTYLITTLNPDDLLNDLPRQIVATLPMVQAGVLWCYDRRSGSLRVMSTFGMQLDEATLDQLVASHVRSGEGRVGMSFQRGEAQLIDARTSREQGGRLSPHNQMIFLQVREQMPADMVSVVLPLRVGNETSGVLELMSFESEQRLRVEDLPVLQTFGELVAAALRNTQLYVQTQTNRSRLQAFDAVGTAISTAADLNDLVRSVLDVILSLVQLKSGALLIYDPGRSRLTLGAHQDLAPSAVDYLRSVPIAGSTCEEAVRYGQPVLRPLMEDRNEEPLIQSGLTSCAYLPLLAGGTVVGVLALYGDVALHEQIDTTTLMPLCSQVGFAIANVKLYEDSQIERNRLNTVINSIAEGVVLCDSRGLLSLANEAAMSLLTLDAVPYDQPLSEMPDFYGIRDLDDQPLPVERLPMARALSGEVFHDYRVLLRGASGRDSVMSFSGAPARTDSGDIEGAVVILRDITASQRLERAKDEFLAVAAHELRSPLAAVRGYADVLLQQEQERTHSDPRDLYGLTTLTQQVAHMLRMVDNLLDVSRLDAGQLDLDIQRVNLVKLAAEVLDQQRPSSDTHALILSADQPELWIACDTLRIRQVLTNLVGNAVRYSPAHSNVIVRVMTELVPDSVAATESDEQPDESHGGSASAPAMEALVTVTDQGSGIAEEHRARLFQRYYRGASRHAEGLGLGLYLSREFVQRHHGRIWVESQEGHGSAFCFTLPMSNQLDDERQKLEDAFWSLISDV